MNLLDSVVDSALGANPELSLLRPVVEKEVLHHDIIRELKKGGFLDELTFMGGTCLRACYGSERLSEDLDFTGGNNFDRASLSELGTSIQRGLHAKYGLQVTVGEPVREEGNVDTWKVKVVTRPEQPHLPAQRIHIDICAIKSHDRRPVMIRNYYGIDMGTSGLMLVAESREEILADKMIALAFRPNRVKNRDIWDIVWLHRQGYRINPDQLIDKLHDRKIDAVDFSTALNDRLVPLVSAFKDYQREMIRFLPKGSLAQFDDPDQYWAYVLDVLNEIAKPLL